MPDDVNIVEPEEVVLSVDDQESVSMSATDVEVVELQTEQAQIIEAISPEADVSKVEEGAKITVTDYRGTTETIIGYDDISSSLVEKAIENYLPTDTAEGAVASFTDGAAMPVKSMVVGVEPVQDLHGYDSPWPAGGGPNLLSSDNISRLSQTVYGVTYTVQADGSVKATGTVTTSTWNFASFYTTLDTYGLSVGDTISVSAFGPHVAFIVQFYNENTLLGSAGTNFGAKTAVIPDDTTRIRLLVYCSDTTPPAAGDTIDKIIYPQLEKASTPSSVWHPYSNICPISGWTGAEICDDPKYGGLIEWNQISKTITSRIVANGITITPYQNDGYVVLDGTTMASGVISAFPPFPVISGHKYAIWGSGTAFGKGCSVYSNIGGNSAFQSAIKTALTTGNFVVTPRSNASVTYSSDTAYVCCCDLTVMFGEGNEPTTIEEFRAFFPNDYYPYNTGELTTVGAVNGITHRHYTIAFPDSAGTVYGGTLDVTNGKLTVDRAEVDIGTLTWGTYDAPYGKTFYATPPGPKRFWQGICSEYKQRISSFSDLENCEFTTNSGAGYAMFVRNDAYTNSADFKTAMSGVQLVYELATPIVYDVDPVTIRTLLGANNIWADTGDVAVNYRADTKLYIDKKIAEMLTQLDGN